MVLSGIKLGFGSPIVLLSSRISCKLYIPVLLEVILVFMPHMCASKGFLLGSVLRTWFKNLLTLALSVSRLNLSGLSTPVFFNRYQYLIMPGRLLLWTLLRGSPGPSTTTAYWWLLTNSLSTHILSLFPTLLLL